MENMSKWPQKVSGGFLPDNQETAKILDMTDFHSDHSISLFLFYFFRFHKRTDGRAGGQTDAWTERADGRTGGSTGGVSKEDSCTRLLSEPQLLERLRSLDSERIYFSKCPRVHPLLRRILYCPLREKLP